MRASFNSPLAEIRKERGMTQKELAEASGVGMSTIQLWESEGTMTANIKTLSKIAETLEVELSRLLPAKLSH